MKIAILGTGLVGQSLAGRLEALGHDVTIGTRDPEVTGARSTPGQWGTPSFSDWHAGHPRVRLATFAAAAGPADLIINATAGGASLGALSAAGAENLAGKVVLDVANPLDFSRGFPPSLSVANTDSLAEQIQRAFPTAKVVKSLNSMNCTVMVNPAGLPGEHLVFLCGDDAAAKQTVAALLEELGWAQAAIFDLGELTAARGMEMILPLWLSISQKLGTYEFNFAIARR